jgi:hypothetical protein
MHHEFVVKGHTRSFGALFYAFSIGSLACFPLLGLGGAFLYLCTCYQKLGEFNKNLLLLYIAITTSIVIGSKQYGMELDFVNYYSDYRTILNDQDSLSEVLNNYGSGFEFVMPLSYWVLAKLNIDFDASKVMIFMTLMILIPFIFWVKNYQKISQLKDNKFIIICSILYISSILYNQLFRQAIASVFILFSLSAEPLRRLIYLSLGTAIHLTTIPIFFLITMLLKRNYKSLILVIIILFFFSYLNLSIVKVSSYNLDYDINNIVFDGFKWVIVDFIIYIAVAIKVGKFPIDDCTKSFIFINLIYIILMPLGYIADRVLLIPILMFNGIFVGNVLGNMRDSKFAYIIIFMLINLKILNYSGILNDYYWIKYPMYSMEPFYYL